MRVFVTGTDGYIGSVLAPLLVARGHEVTGLDTNYFSEAELEPWAEPGFTRIARDVRRIMPADVEGFDAVIHLAGLSNDALGMLSRQVTYRINHYGTMRLAGLAKAAGVTRFLYSSSCSLYGRSGDAMVTEDSPLDPKTDYAVCKMLDELELADLADDRFSPTFLRNATAYGASPRMRFDLVVNNLSGLAFTQNRIAMTSDGTPWRPIVHVMDISAAFIAALEAPREKVHNKAFNIGRTDENFRVREIAEAVADVFPDCALSFGDTDPDQRSYRVSFDRAAQELPAFSCSWDLRRGIRQLRELYQRVELDPDRFQFRPYTRLQQLKHLIGRGAIDADFFWTRP